MTSSINDSNASTAWDSSLRPPFVTKLRTIVDDPSTDYLISWTEDGTAFQVHLPSEFARTVLPRYFKHSNFTSFARQLNQYGFRKIDCDRFIFGNRYFLRDAPELLEKMARRRPVRTLVQRGSSPPSLSSAALEIGNYGLGSGDLAEKSDVDLLRRDKQLLIRELLSSRHQQSDLERRLRQSEERIHQLESGMDQMRTFLYQSFQLMLQQQGLPMEPRKRKRLTNMGSPESSPLESIEYKSESGQDETMSVPSPTLQTLAVRHPLPESMELIRSLMAQLQMANRTSRRMDTHDGHRDFRERPSSRIHESPEINDEEGSASNAKVREMQTPTKRNAGPSILLLDDELPTGDTKDPLPDTTQSPDAHVPDGRDVAVDEDQDFDFSDYLNIDQLLDMANGEPLPSPTGPEAELMAEEVRKMLKDDLEETSGS